RVYLRPEWFAAFYTAMSESWPTYADAAVNHQGGLWFSSLTDETTEVVWPTYSEAITDNLYTSRGPYYVIAWINEYTAMEWPTIDQGISDDVFVRLGPDWTAAYFNEPSVSWPDYNNFTNHV